MIVLIKYHEVSILWRQACIMVHPINTRDRWHRSHLPSWSQRIINHWRKRYPYTHDHHHFWLFYHAWQHSSKAMLNAFVQGYYPVGCVQAYYRLMPSSSPSTQQPALPSHATHDGIRQTPAPMQDRCLMQDSNKSTQQLTGDLLKPVAKSYQNLTHYYE